MHTSRIEIKDRASHEDTDGVNVRVQELHDEVTSSCNEAQLQSLIVQIIIEKI